MIEKINDLVDKVVEDNHDAMKAYIELTRIEKALKNAKEIVKEIALEETKDFGKEFEFDGYKIERRNGKKTYDFKHIPEFQQAKEKMDDVKAKYKGALSAYEKGISSVTSDGEIMQLPIVTFAQDSLIIKEQ